MDEQNKIAVLIDAENVSSKYVKLIMDEVGSYGVATYKRLYGDFTKPSVKSWLSKLQEYAITPVFQYNYTQGKNASDSALIIDAMDILYTENVSGFCLVTSDSDFTKLAMRLRESGMIVIGMGEQKTPSSLVSACENFKYLDLLSQESGSVPAGSLSQENRLDETKKESNGIPSRAEIEREIRAIIEAKTEEEWINLSEVGITLSKRVPGFDPRNYKYQKLRQLIESFDAFETKAIPNPHNKLLKIVYVKEKEYS
uniref:NYN domain-containing protein n=1 Tax=Roseburia sp. TaxID=2049040 RepID=UPI003FEEC564